jgi:hypothetical protein
MSKQFDSKNPSTWGLSDPDTSAALELVARVEHFDREDPATWNQPKTVTNWQFDGLDREFITEDMENCFEQARQARAACVGGSKAKYADLMEANGNRLREALEEGPVVKHSRAEALAKWISGFSLEDPGTWGLTNGELGKARDLRCDAPAYEAMGMQILADWKSGFEEERKSGLRAFLSDEVALWKYKLAAIESFQGLLASIGGGPSAGLCRP